MWKNHAQIVAWSCGVEGHAPKCVERHCEWANKKVEQLCKVFKSPAWMITNSRRKNLNQLENYQKHAHKSSWHACIWHELEDLRFHGQSTNLQEQSQNGNRLATDVWQDWFHTFITQMITDNIVMWSTRLSIVDRVYSKTQTLLVILRTQNITSGGVLCIFGVERTFVSISWMCKKQTSISRSSTESEIISLELDCAWMDCLVTFHNNTARQGSIAQGDLCGRGEHSINKNKTKTPTAKRERQVEQLSNVDYVPTITHSSQCESQYTLLKTTKLSSRWLSKDEVQRWDTCPGPTELRLIGCSTESTWNQRSKSNMLTPKINLLRCWPKEFHARRVEPSSSFVQHNEFLDVLLQTLQKFSFHHATMRF